MFDVVDHVLYPNGKNEREMGNLPLLCLFGAMNSSNTVLLIIDLFPVGNECTLSFPAAHFQDLDYVNQTSYLLPGDWIK